MITTYIMDIRQLAAPELFETYYHAMPSKRQKKIDALRHQADKRRSLAAGILLLHGLSSFNIKKEQIQFCYGPHNKPYVKDLPQIQFNLSHAGNYAAAAFGTKELGIDIEETNRNGTKIPSRFYTEKEQKYLGQITEEKAWNQAFTKLWTRKESFVKAIGTGLSFGLEHVETLEGYAKTPLHRQYQAPLWLFHEYQIEGYWITVCSQEPICRKELTWIPKKLPISGINKAETGIYQEYSGN